MSDSDSAYGKDIHAEHVKMIAENCGFSDLSDDIATVLADDVTSMIKVLVQDAVKFMVHSKRKRLTCEDINYIFKVKNLEPVYGYSTKEMCGSYSEDELDLNDIVKEPPVPLEVSVRAHWFCIDGVQTNAPENLTSVSKVLKNRKRIDYSSDPKQDYYDTDSEIKRSDHNIESDMKEDMEDNYDLDMKNNTGENDYHSNSEMEKNTKNDDNVSDEKNYHDSVTEMKLCKDEKVTDCDSEMQENDHNLDSEMKKNEDMKQGDYDTDVEKKRNDDSDCGKKSDHNSEPDSEMKMKKRDCDSEMTVVCRPRKLRKYETVYVKNLTMHPVSAEQQRFYLFVTEACVGKCEVTRIHALETLEHDPNIILLLPHLSVFINETVRHNVVQNEFAILVYAMRMIKSLLNNENLYIPKYLHELLPPILTCIVTQHLANYPVFQSQWCLRKFAASLIVRICRDYNTNTNNIEGKVIQIFRRALFEEGHNLVTLYGAVIGLSSFGQQIIEDHLLPSVKFIADRIEPYFTLPREMTQKITSERIRSALISAVAPIVKEKKQPPHVIGDYLKEFGWLGMGIHLAVVTHDGAVQDMTSGPSTTNNNVVTPTKSQPRQTVITRTARPGQKHVQVIRKLVPFDSRKILKPVYRRVTQAQIGSNHPFTGCSRNGQDVKEEEKDAEASSRSSGQDQN